MKKHKLLREDILPAMATNRKVQRLLNEFMDLLSEYESAEANAEHQNQIAPTCLVADQVDSFPSATNQIDPVPTTTDGVGNQNVPAATDQKDNNPVATDQENSAPPKTDRVDLNSPLMEEMNLSPQAKDAGS